jgi:hypothetical protein
LTGADYPNAPPFNGEMDRWTYDPIGNRLTAAAGASTATYTYQKVTGNTQNAPLRFSDPLGLAQWPFGGGLFCLDKSCGCGPPPPIKVLGEDTFSFVATPAPGQCVESDAVYSPSGVPPGWPVNPF